MKKFFIYVFVLGFIQIPLQRGYAENLLQNSSFEQWHDTLGFSVPNYWISTELESDPIFVLTRVIKSSHAHTGNYAAKIKILPGDSGAVGGLRTTANVIGGASYNLRSYYDCPTGVRGYILLVEISATDTFLTIYRELGHTTAYTLYDTSFTTFDSTKEIWVLCMISAEGDSTWEIYFDDVELNGLAVEERGVTSSGFALFENQPNPFYGVTEIKYVLPKESNVCISVYSISGQRIRTLIHEIQEPGCNLVYWDGKDTTGKEMPMGIYFYHMEAGEFKATRKLTILK